jgi:hypothetical protein
MDGCALMALRLNGKLADVYMDNEDNQNDLKTFLLCSCAVTCDQRKSKILTNEIGIAAHRRGKQGI